MAKRTMRTNGRYVMILPVLVYFRTILFHSIFMQAMLNFEVKFNMEL